MEQKEFTIKSLPNEQFRIAKISPVDLLAISAQIDFDKFTQTRDTFAFCLEHTEVKVVDKWLPVKTAGRDVYWPNGIENNMLALNEIITYFMQEVISKSFTQSNE